MTPRNLEDALRRIRELEGLLRETADELDTRCDAADDDVIMSLLARVQEALGS